MSAQTTGQTRPRRATKQDAEVKGNPYAATYHATEDAGDVYLVRSASSDRVYFTTLHRDDFEQDDCSCDATRRCWHKDAARLRQQIERVTANCEAYYGQWGLLQLQAEDARMRSELAETDSWILRAQLAVVGDCILARLNEAQEVA